jgi:hypothetical protein
MTWRFVLCVGVKRLILKHSQTNRHAVKFLQADRFILKSSQAGEFIVKRCLYHYFNFQFMLPLIIYCLCEIQAVLDFRRTHTFVHNKFSPLIRLGYATFGLTHIAGEQTFQAVTQWCSRTESQTVFCVY